MVAAADKKRWHRQKNEIYEIEDEPGRKGELKQIALSVLDKVQAAGQHKLPMLPRVAMRAMEVANNPDVSIKELQRLITPEPMITARVMAIANSAMYSGGSKVKNLGNALQRLGVSLMRDILYQTVAEAHIFHGKSEKQLRYIGAHSVFVAYLTREVWRQLGAKHDYAFVAGLLHDVGAVILLQMLGEDRSSGTHVYGDQWKSDELPRIIEMIHPHVGELVCKRWKLPGPVIEAARRHHKYHGFEGGGGGYSQLGNTIAAAEVLGAHVGLGEVEAEPAPIPEEGMAPFFQLGLAEDQIEELKDKAHLIRGQLG